MSSSTTYVPRVIQLDALLLDKEFYSLVKNQIFNIFNSFKVDGITDKYSAELRLLIKFAIWKLSVFRKEASIGQALLGIKYSYDKARLRLLFLLDAVVPYLYERCGTFLRTSLYFQRIERPLRYLEDGVKLCEILNFLTFLLQNRYPSLVHRLLQLQMEPMFGRVHPSVGYSYQLREMLWHQFADFLIVVLPVINIHRIKRYLKQWGFMSGTHAKRNLPEMEDNSVLKCCVCNEDAVIPQRVEGCVFCYYCLKANTMADPEFETSCDH